MVENLKCSKCNKEVSYDKAKGLIIIHQDNQIEYYSVVCDGCKK